MFRGSSFHTIDPKGRIVIPSRFRSVLQAGGGEAVVITRHFKCLYGYTLDAWKNVVDRILNAADKNDTVIRFNRFFIGQSQECSLDKQSRVLVPPVLRQYAQLSKDIVLVGVLDHFEIWSRENWDKESELMEMEMQKEEVRTQIAKLGI